MDKKKSAGQLRERITIQQKNFAASNEDAHGQPLDTYTDLTNRSKEAAAIEPVSGAEVVEASQLVGVAVFMVEIRYREDLTTDMRLRWDSRTTAVYLYIKSLPADPTGRKERVRFVAVQSDKEL